MDADLRFDTNLRHDSDSLNGCRFYLQKRGQKENGVNRKGVKYEWHLLKVVQVIFY